MPIRLVRWAGPILLTLGAIAIIAILLLPRESRGTLGWWILSNIFAYQRILPVACFGATLALVSLSQCIAAVVFLVSGMALGFIFADPFLSAVASIPGAAANHFLTGPILCIAVGLSLIASERIRSWVLPVAAICVGAFFAVTIRLTDPSYRDPTIMITGIGVGAWALTAISLTVRTFRQTWFETAGRIVGSWLLAIGLLYGGVSLIPPQIAAPLDELETTPSPTNQSMEPSSDMSPPDQSNPQASPEGFNPSRQP